MQEDDRKEVENSPSASPASGEAKEKLLAEAQASETHEKEALHELFEQAVGMRGQKPKEEEPPADPDSIAHITSNQIKTMRNVTAKQADPEAPFGEQVVPMLIKIFYDFKSIFSFSRTGGRDRCLISGHQCKHCGGIFYGTTATPEKK
jgi:hypothetical protein